MRKINFIWLALGTLALMMCIIWVARVEVKAAPQKSPLQQKSPVARPSSGKPFNTRSSTVPGDPNKSDSPEHASTIPLIIDEINDASVMYDPAYLPAIEKYLLHQDVEVRKSAINGMIVLGHRAAAPMLRAASKLAPTPYEAVDMLKAADYLELPSASMIEDDKIKPSK